MPDFFPFNQTNGHMRIKPAALTQLLPFCTMLYLLFITGESYSQDLSLNVKKAPLPTIVESLRRQTGVDFLYKNTAVKHFRPVTVHLENKTLPEILDSCFKDQYVTYRIVNKTVLIVPRENSKPEQPSPPAVKVIHVTGTVVDSATNQALQGVSVAVEGNATTGAMTDANGAFQIDVPDAGSVLLFSYIGYKTGRVIVGANTNLLIRLSKTDSKLNEVIVVSYGTQKKITSIGAQSSIKADELKQPVANLTNSIAGRVAGIIGVQRSGEPGYDNADIYIRGISTFTSSAPLVLVDGVDRSFNNVDPEDIASFTILKDASATAMYGVRGANGVILIQTKKGKSGKGSINIQYDQGITEFTRLPKFADGVTYMEISNEAYKNSNPNDTTLRYSLERIAKTANQLDPDLYPNVNWFDAIFNRFGHNQRARVNASGGSEKAQYYLSIGYYNETGMFKTDELAGYNSSMKFKRYNFTSNLTLHVTKTMKIDFGASGWISNGNYPGNATGSIFNAAYVLPPISIPVKYSNGAFSQLRTGDIYNPYTLLTQSGYATEFRTQLWSNIRATQNLDFLLQGLSLTAMFSFDNYNQHNIQRTKSVDGYLATGRDSSGKLILDKTRIGTNYLGYSRSNGGNRQFYTEAVVNYNRMFGNHEVTGMLLYNQSDKVEAFAGDFISSIPFRYIGLAGRMTYAYDNKYLAEANFGYNGSETFAPDHQFGFFPSFGAGWVASEEKFFSSLKNALSFFKLRFSYGEVGNSNIGGRRFAYISTINSQNGYSYGRNNVNNNIDGLNFGDYAVTVTWEKAAKYNLGVEMKTWNNDLSLTVDLFREKRTGIFRQRGDVPTIVGITNLPYANLGAVNNKGIDATLEMNKRLGKNVTVGFKSNFTWNRSKVIDDANALWPYPWQQRIGRKLGQRFGYMALGLFQSKEEVDKSPSQVGTNLPGDIKYADLNEDGKIDAYDQGPIGYGSIPEIVYGFGPTVSWKNWSIAAWFKGISAVDISLSGDGFRPFTYGGERGNLLAQITDRWTPDNPNSKPLYPRITYGNDNMNFESSSWWVKNGAFLRLQTAELNYDLNNKKWLKRIGASHLNIYFIGYNLVTFSGFKLWDVELGDGRGSQYPLLKTYNFGFRCMF
jgi:TonB-linked SusC/RagA family outer membrane protein